MSLFSVCSLVFIHVFLNSNSMISFEPFLSSLHSCIKCPETEVRLSTALDCSLPHSLRSSDPRSIRQDLHKSAEKLPVGRAGQTDGHVLLKSVAFREQGIPGMEVVWVVWTLEGGSPRRG